MGTGCLTLLTHKSGVYKKKSKFKGSDMRTREEEREIVKRALAMLHGSPKPEQGGQQIAEPEPEAGTAETIAVSILVESKPDEANRIVAVWKELFGMSLKSEEVRSHLAAIRKWQSQWMNGNGNEG